VSRQVVDPYNDKVQDQLITAMKRALPGVTSNSA